SIAWLVAAQFGLYALGWALFSFMLRDQRAAVAHWSGFLLLMGLGFLLAAGRDEQRLWLPYVGSSLAYLAGWVLLRRGLGEFMRVSTGDRELFVAASLAGATLLIAGPGVEHASLRVFATYAVGAWIFARTVLAVARGITAEFGRATMILVTL